MLVVASVEGASPVQAEIDRRKISPIQVRVVVLCLLLAICEGIDLALVPIIAPSIAKDWGLAANDLAVVFSAGPVGLIIGGLVVGFLSDRLGRKPALIVAMMLMTVGTVAIFYSSALWQLIACRLLTGVGFGGVIPAMTALVAEFIPARRRATVIPYVVLGQTIGSTMSAALVRILLDDLGWRGLIMAVSFLCLLFTGLITAFLPESPQFLYLRDPRGGRLRRILAALGIDEVPPSPAAPAKPLPRRSLRQFTSIFADGRLQGTILLWLMYFCLSIDVSFFINWVTTVYAQAGKSPAASVDATLYYHIGGIAGGLLLPVLCTRAGLNRVLAALLVLGAGGLSLVAATLHAPGLINPAALVLCGVLIPGAYFISFPLMVNFYPTDIRSTAVGSVTSFGRLGNVGGPLVVGAMLTAGASPASTIFAMAVPAAIAGVLVVAFTRSQAKRTIAGVD